jgi:hypothetical protein
VPCGDDWAPADGGEDDADQMRAPGEAGERAAS